MIFFLLSQPLVQQDLRICLPHSLKTSKYVLIRGLTMTRFIKQLCQIRREMRRMEALV